MHHAEQPESPAANASVDEETSSPRLTLRDKARFALKRLVSRIEVAAPRVLPILPNRRVAGEVQIGGCTVCYYRHWPDDAKLLADWDALVAEVPGATTFQSPLWQCGATTVPDALGRLRLITVHRDGRLVAVVPLQRRWGGRWSTVAAVITTFHDPLVHPDDAAQTWDALLRGLQRFDPRLHSLTLEMLSPDCPCVDIVPRIAQAAGYGGGAAPTHLIDTAIDLPSTWDGYLASLRKNDRSKLRRRLKKVQESGRARFVVCESEPDVVAALPGVLDLMQRSSGAKGRRSRGLYRPHLLKVAPALARSGRLVIYQLWIEDRLAAGDIVLPGGRTQFWWNGAMDPAMRDWSPGIAMLAMMIRRAIEQGCTTINLGRGMIDYKRELGATIRPMHKLVFTR